MNVGRQIIRFLAVKQQEKEMAAAIAKDGPLARFVRWCPRCVMPTTHGLAAGVQFSPAPGYAYIKAVQCGRCNVRYLPMPGTLSLTTEDFPEAGLRPTTRDPLAFAMKIPGTIENGVLGEARARAITAAVNVGPPADRSKLH